MEGETGRIFENSVANETVKELYSIHSRVNADGLSAIDLDSVLRCCK